MIKYLTILVIAVSSISAVSVKFSGCSKFILQSYYYFLLQYHLFTALNVTMPFWIWYRAVNIRTETFAIWGCCTTFKCKREKKTKRMDTDKHGVKEFLIIISQCSLHHPRCKNRYILEIIRKGIDTLKHKIIICQY